MPPKQSIKGIQSDLRMILQNPDFFRDFCILNAEINIKKLINIHEKNSFLCILFYNTRRFTILQSSKKNLFKLQIFYKIPTKRDRKKYMEIK